MDKQSASKKQFDLSCHLLFALLFCESLVLFSLVFSMDFLFFFFTAFPCYCKL